MDKWDIKEKISEIQALTYSLLFAVIELESQSLACPYISGTAEVIMKMLEELQEDLT